MCGWQEWDSIFNSPKFKTTLLALENGSSAQRGREYSTPVITLCLFTGFKHDVQKTNEI